MDLQTQEETCAVLGDFFRKRPDVLHKLPTVRKAVEKAMAEAEQRGRRRGVQRVLTIVLQHKFGALPEKVVQVSAITDSIEQLDQWLQEALDATSLAEINLIPKAN